MSHRQPIKNRFCPTFEMLEKRDAMSVTSVSLNAGTLQIICDNASDSVEIRQGPGLEPPILTYANAASSAPMLYSANLAYDIRNPGTVHSPLVTVKDLTKAPNALWEFNRSQIQRIEVRLGEGDNTLDSNVNLPTTVKAGTGADRITTGDGDDTIHCGKGNDTAITNGGLDKVFGEDGNDTIATGAGDDTVYPGNGADAVFAGSGHDYIYEALDTNYRSKNRAVRGTPGGNILYGDADNDTIISVYDNDVVDGGAGFDTLRVKAGTWVVRNGEDVQIDVPLGKATKGGSRGSAVNSGYRLLRAYGFNPTRSVVLTDDTWGLSPSNLRNLLATTKPDLTLETDVGRQRVIDLVNAGKPVIVQAFPTTPSLSRYVVVNGFDAATGQFKFVDIDGKQKMSSRLISIFQTERYTIIS